MDLFEYQGKQLFARYGIPAASHVDGIMLGRKLDAVEALERGVVHEVAASVDVAVGRARDFLARGSLAVRAIKQALRREALERAQERAVDSRAKWLDAFYASEAQERIGALVKKLENK